MKLLFMAIIGFGILMFSLGVLVGYGYRVNVDYNASQISPETAIFLLGSARDAHQFYVDNPDKAYYATREGQDAQWVYRYNQIIELIEALNGIKIQG